MHELSIVQALIEQVEREVRRTGQRGRVVKLELLIGRFSGVCPDSLRFAFDLLVPETPLAGAEVQIQEPGAVCACNACGRTTDLAELVFQCPHCQSDDIAIQGGQDLVLQTIELAD